MIKYQYIHNNKKYIDQLIKLLNKQWPRSEYSRMISIEKSKDELPLYLIMLDEIETIDENNNKIKIEELIGCVMISPVLNSKGSVLIENVLIKSEYRGKGYGKLIMKEAHSIIKEKQYFISYLSTNDQKEFYKTLGYQECDPLITSNFSSNNNYDNGSNKNIDNSDNESDVKDDSDKVSNLLRIFGGGGKKTKKEETLVWMKLNLE